MLVAHLLESEKTTDIYVALDRIGPAKLKKMLLDVMGHDDNVIDGGSRIFFDSWPFMVVTTLEDDEDIDLTERMFIKVLKQVFAPHIDVNVKPGKRGMERGKQHFSIRVTPA